MGKIQCRKANIRKQILLFIKRHGLDSQANNNFRIPVLQNCQKTKINNNASESEPCHNIKYKMQGQ